MAHIHTALALNLAPNPISRLNTISLLNDWCPGNLRHASSLPSPLCKPRPLQQLIGCLRAVRGSWMRSRLQLYDSFCPAGRLCSYRGGFSSIKGNLRCPALWWSHVARPPSRQTLESLKMLGGKYFWDNVTLKLLFRRWVPPRASMMVASVVGCVFQASAAWC